MTDHGEPVLGISGPQDEHGVVDQVERQRWNVIRLIVEPSSDKNTVLMLPPGRNALERHTGQKVQIDSGQIFGGSIDVIVDHRLVLQVDALVFVGSG